MCSLAKHEIGREPKPIKLKCNDEGYFSLISGALVGKPFMNALDLWGYAFLQQMKVRCL